MIRILSQLLNTKVPYELYRTVPGGYGYGFEESSRKVYYYLTFKWEHHNGCDDLIKKIIGDYIFSSRKLIEEKTEIEVHLYEIVGFVYIGGCNHKCVKLVCDESHNNIFYGKLIVVLRLVKLINDNIVERDKTLSVLRKNLDELVQLGIVDGHNGIPDVDKIGITKKCISNVEPTEDIKELILSIN